MQVADDVLSIKPIRTYAKATPWIVCLTSALFFFYEFMQANMFSSIAAEVMNSFNINVLQYSWLSSAYYIANVLFLFPAGIILDKYSTKKIIISTLLLCIISTAAFAVSDNYVLALLCRFVTGIGGAFCFLSSIRLATQWFGYKKLAFVTGIIVTLAMTGGMISQVPLVLLIDSVGWRNAILCDAAFGIIIFVMILNFVQDYPADLSRSETLHDKASGHLGFWKSCHAAYFNRQNLLCAVYASLLNMPIVVLGALAGGLYLVQVDNLSRTQASLVNSLIFIGTIIGGPLIGWISDRIGLRKLPMLLGAIISLFIVLLIIYVEPLNLFCLMGLFLLLGLATSSQVLSYPLVAESNSPLLTATAVSVVSVFTQGGTVVYQTLFGYLLQLDLVGGLSGQLAIYSPADYLRALMIIPIGFIIAIGAVFYIRDSSRK